MQRVAACFLFAASLLAQAPAHIPADLRFEVASLKPSNGKEPGYGIRPAPGGQRYEAWNCPINMMIQAAYGVKPQQIMGGPSWLNTEPFDMDAKAEKPSGIDENGEEPDTSGPTVFDALKQQLGLELKAQKGLAEVIVIDHVERPTEN